MNSWKFSLKQTAVTVYIFFLIIALGYAVGFAAHGQMLVKIALPLGLAVILAVFWLGRTAELLAWAGLTTWLGMTYAHTGPPVEIAVFFGYVACAALGVFRSPWFLAIPWLAHIGWDFLPRSLPKMYEELPHACALFDGPIGLYLAWGAWRRRWPQLSPTPNPQPTTDPHP
ncbi:hypothetical protein Verru16b_00561 [Lacunisphaera limnophila]|uniref:CAAX amino terminal protease self-immunity n=1 Tax=Lacunisphaera limnophila TaxID=1838286 RepID=A0A1D8ARL1_9BACT|nr:hypothetical protein [Lacunisphaera limnophila]AOS43516.1 hypothetical protein Verru16b_00561 [Lacunisphaera limnophila]